MFTPRLAQVSWDVERGLNVAAKLLYVVTLPVRVGTVPSVTRTVRSSAYLWTCSESPIPSGRMACLVVCTWLIDATRWCAHWQHSRFGLQ